MDFDEEDVRKIKIVRAVRQPSKNKDKAHVEVVCQTSQMRDNIFASSGKIPFQNPGGRIYARYPVSWNLKRGRLEQQAKALRDHRLEEAPGDEVFHAQIRYWDATGMAVFVKRCLDPATRGWMPLPDALKKYPREDFPPEIWSLKGK